MILDRGMDVFIDIDPAGDLLQINIQ